MPTLTKANKYAKEGLAEVEDLFDFIDNARIHSATGQQSAGQLRGVYEGCFPAVFMNAAAGRGEDHTYIDPEIFDVMWPLDFSSITIGDSGFPTLCRITSISMKEARGRVKQIAPKIIRYNVFAAHDNHSVGGSPSVYFGIWPGGLVREITNVEWLPGVHLEHERDVIIVVAGLCLTAYYNWHVVIGAVGSSVKIKIPATPKSAREFVSLRDIPDGMERRAAIKHWVASHDRKLQEGALTTVREHLRGRESFTWADYEGWVEPSLHDMARTTTTAKDRTDAR